MHCFCCSARIVISAVLHIEDIVDINLQPEVCSCSLHDKR